MKLNRNHYFLMGLILLFLGLQFRMVESVVLNQPTSTFLAQRLNSPQENATFRLTSLFPGNANSPLRTVTPPRWIGWALVSVGAVLILHAAAMKKPEGAG